MLERLKARLDGKLVLGILSSSIASQGYWNVPLNLFDCRSAFTSLVFFLKCFKLCRKK